MRSLLFTGDHYLIEVCTSSRIRVRMIQLAVFFANETLNGNLKQFHATRLSFRKNEPDLYTIRQDTQFLIT